MRRSDRELRSWEEKMAVLARCRILRVALCDDEGLYLVPLSFGYRAEGNRLTLYLMAAGTKIRPDDVTGTVDALENDALEIFSELSSDQYVAAVLDLTMTPMQRPMTSHGDVSLAVGADVVCIF